MSQIEAEHLLTKVRQVRNHAEGGQLVQKATRYMTHAEKESKREELRRVQETLDPSNIAIGSLTQEGRGNLVRYKQHLEKDLRENVAPEVPVAIKDDLIKAEHELAEDIRQGMLPEETMRRNPPGSVARHIKWEREKKEKILTWKNLRRMNHPEDDSEDLANIELLRPTETLPGRLNAFHADAQIPGHFAMSPQAKENWPENMPEFGTVDSPLKQAERRELEQLRAQVAGMEKELKKAKPNSSAKNYKRWTCDYEGCGKEMPLFQKGVHIAAHRRMDRDLAKVQKELDRLDAEKAAQAEGV